MNRSFRILICFCLFSLAVGAQQRRSQKMAGPMDGGQFRIAVVFMENPDAESYKIQSLIVTVPASKKKAELPGEYLVDLTTTVRNLASGAKNQKILVLRWGKSGEVEVKCEGGKWNRQAADPEIDPIIETVKAVVQKAPLDAKQPIDFTVPAELEQKVISILEGLPQSKLQCVRSGS